jgi:hypothetical protein
MHEANVNIDSFVTFGQNRKTTRGARASGPGAPGVEHGYPYTYPALPDPAPGRVARTPDKHYVCLTTVHL